MSEEKNLVPTLGLAASDTTGKMIKHKFFRRAIGANDIHIQISYSGICHSDIHTGKGEWGPKEYPLVVGHEIIGNVVAVGSSVSKFKVGDVAGVGCFLDSCRSCTECKEGDEQYCTGPGGFTGTYGSKRDESLHPGGQTHGGYSKDIVIDENYALSVPANLNCPAGTPLLCAGITCYSPFVHYGLKKGMTLGVVGLGGLGHMAVKIGLAMGCNIVVFSTSPGKEPEAKAMGPEGAVKFVVSKDEGQMKAQAKSCNMIYDSVSAKHPLKPYLNCLRSSGTLIMVGGVPDKFSDIGSFDLLPRRLKVGGSCIGGIRETQEMLDFCSKHNVTCDVEVIKAEPELVDKAWDRAVKGDVKFRFVIDTAATLKE